jgi:hypothetical protein
MALTALACAGGGPTGTPTAPGNRAACSDYVRAINALGSCVDVTYDPDNLCTGAAELPPEMAEYYRCLATSSRCEGDRAVIGEGCTPPMVPLSTERVAGPVDVPQDPSDPVRVREGQ